MSLFTIDEKKCKRDGICAADCPFGLIEMKDSSSVPTAVADAEELCIACGHCVAVCPHGAISHSAIPREAFPPVRKELIPSRDQVEQFLRSRRSIRRYRDQEVDRDKLTRLIQIARYAPTGTNSQKVGWIVVSSRKSVKKLTGMIIDCLQALIRDEHPLARAYNLANIVNAWEGGVDIISRDAPALVFTHAPASYPLAQIDCASAMSYFDLAASTFGLGACWAGFFMLAIPLWPPLQQALALPEGHAVFGVMIVGHPKYQYFRLPPRKEAQVVWKQ